MTEFLSPTDIGNRALQHVGAQRMDPTLGFSENSLNATEVSFAYGKLRRSELQERVWTFATRKAVIRAIDSNTLLLAPTLWNASATYFPGQIVADAVGTLWRSMIGNNTGNPVATSQGIWEPYFGSMTVALYDSSKAYNAGELVYTAAGNGTANTYESTVAGNSVHPALPNQWSVSTTYFSGQVVQTWPAWSSGTTYSQGQGILYTDNNVYVSLTNSNLNNIPPSSGTNWVLLPVLVLQSQAVPINTATLVMLPTSSPVTEWAQGTTYSLGSVVMFNAAEYVSIANNNTGNFPNAASSTFWIAISNFTLSMSLIDLNIGNNPSSSPAAWASGTTYALNALVAGSDGQEYKSLANGNVANNPVTDGGVHWLATGTLVPWTTVFTLGGGNDLWIQVGGAAFPNGVGLTDLNITYPIGSGPVSQTWSKNAYRLPAGYLRRAPQDPKAGSFSWLGAPSAPMQDDWEYQGNFFTTWRSDPITYRFVADVTDVTQFHDKFCEGLAAKIGEEVCHRLTQSTAKIQVCQAQYREAMGMAKLVNAIEAGSEQPPMDDWITCRF